MGWARDMGMGTMGMAGWLGQRSELWAAKTPKVEEERVEGGQGKGLSDGAAH